MPLQELQELISDFAKDVRLNFSSMLKDETLLPQSKYGLILACAITSRNSYLRAAAELEAAAHLTPDALRAAKTAASLMAMNNIYYRFTHLATNKEYSAMPARLRMNAMGGFGVEKADFEIWSLAVSAINGCGACIDAHEKTLLEHGVTTNVIQTAVRFAAIVQSVAIALEAGGVSR